MTEQRTVRKKHVCLLIFITLIGTGCIKVGPGFIRPGSVVSPSWIESSDPRMQTDSFLSREWWRVFNDPVLDGLIDRAYKENLNLRIAGLRVLEARAQLGVATGQYFPQTQEALASLEQSRASDRAQTALRGGSLTTRQDQFGVLTSWELDFWGKFRRNIESAQAALHATVADYDAALVSLTADVANAYIVLRTAEKRIEIAEENVKAQKEALRLSEARVAGGATTQLDVEQAKISLTETQSLVPLLQSQLRQAKNALCVLLGIPPNDLATVITGPAVIPAPPLKVVVGIPADLLVRRPDIRSALYQAASQSARIGVAKADLFPSLSLTGSFGYLTTDVSGFALKDIFRWGSRYYTVGPAAQWSLFNYGRITNAVRVEDARFQQSLIAYQNTVLKAQQEVEDGLVAFLRAQEQGAFLAESAAAAQHSLNISMVQYKEGAKDFTAVLLAQFVLLRQQDSLTVTLGAVSADLVAVYRSLGGGWEIREGHDFIPPDVREMMVKRTDWGELLAHPKSIHTTTVRDNVGP
jgi:NodT family efflux transporter outer membrane factor (OMF) lipoprotein